MTYPKKGDRILCINELEYGNYTKGETYRVISATNEQRIVIEDNDGYRHSFTLNDVKNEYGYPPINDHFLSIKELRNRTMETILL